MQKLQASSLNRVQILEGQELDHAQNHCLSDDDNDAPVAFALLVTQGLDEELSLLPSISCHVQNDLLHGVGGGRHEEHPLQVLGSSGLRSDQPIEEHRHHQQWDGKNHGLLRRGSKRRDALEHRVKEEEAEQHPSQHRRQVLGCKSDDEVDDEGLQGRADQRQRRRGEGRREDVCARGVQHLRRLQLHEEALVNPSRDQR
mmetsp:Transcript_42617/g.122003  ORF Transcript_42617/g.122003 Transcript_42617/m.122003 type:complete len:200 (+) Transcript_42617:134-733(+)